MDVFPNIGQIKKFFISRRDSLKQAWENGEYGWIFFYLFIVLPLFLILYISLTVNAINIIAIGWVKFFPPKIEITYPPRKITYGRIGDQKKDEDGLYRNTFEVHVFTPAGNTSQPMTVDVNIADAECPPRPISTKLIDSGPGLSSTTEISIYDCISKMPIIDTKNLFKLATDTKEQT